MEDVKQHLMDQLKKPNTLITTGSFELIYYVKTYSHCLHIYQNSSGLVAAHSFDADFQDDWDGTPNLGLHNSWDDCLQSLVRVFSRLWNSPRSS